MGFPGSLTRLMIRILCSLLLCPVQRRVPTNCLSFDIWLLYFASMARSDLDRPSLPLPPPHHSKNYRRRHHLRHYYFHCLHPKNRLLHRRGQRSPLATAIILGSLALLGRSFRRCLLNVYFDFQHHLPLPRHPLS